jgi:hypothetical protein
VVLDTPAEDAGSQAFPILAGYIFGKNKGEKKFAMTAPVTQAAAPVRMDMTAPVTQVAVAGGMRVQFVLPKGVTLATAPEPIDPRVQLRLVPAGTWAVLRYSGTWSQANYLEHLDGLKAALQAAGVATQGEPVLARYNAPLHAVVHAAQRGLVGTALMRSLPGLAAGLALERADQLGRDPAAVEAAGLRQDGCTVHLAIKRRRIERNAIGQRFGTGQRLRVTPGHAGQAAIAMDQGPVPRRPLPFAERTSCSRLQEKSRHVTPRQVHTRRVSRFKHKHGTSRARHLEITPAHHHFARVRHQAGRAWEVPNRCLARPRRRGKGWPNLTLPAPLLARRADPVGKLGHQFGNAQTRLGRGIGLVMGFDFRAITGDLAVRSGS